MKFGYTIIYVKDVKAALAFYSKAFGFETRFATDTGDYGELETGATTLAFASHALGQANLNQPYHKVDGATEPLGIELAFVSEDVAAAYARAIKAGAVEIAPPAQKPWGQVVAYVRAKEGTLIEICSPVEG
ncbi:MAG TPA: VOC family protein [Thermoflexales bacterium]|nr:VOC family protein [Thermoflexales bacterium]HQW34841.1 VOC family protein [Thermoflexales bacterium]HQX74665.1 VOC family protein [Thermoflexales bacterium]HQZ22340.1 VOC family protein [Thermoflexales bacterium]HQZ98887.1 VOC family protein [Thermoflexales bacterium]